MRGSCLKTLAAKYNSSVMKMYKKYRSVKGDFGADYKTKSGTKRCEFYNEGFRRNNNICLLYTSGIRCIVTLYQFQSGNGAFLRAVSYTHLDAGAEEGKMIPLTTLLFGDSVRPPRS